MSWHWREIPSIRKPDVKYGFTSDRGLTSKIYKELTL